MALGTEIILRYLLPCGPFNGLLLVCVCDPIHRKLDTFGLCSLIKVIRWLTSADGNSEGAIMPTSVNRRFYADQSSVMSTYVNFITNLLPGRATGKTRHGLRTIRASSTCHVIYYRCSSRLMWIFGTFNRCQSLDCFTTRSTTASCSQNIKCISKKRLARIPSSSGASLLGEHCNYSDYYATMLL